MSFNIEVDGGKTVRLPTAGKYCDRDIVISAKGAAAAPVIQPLEVTENGTYTASDGVDGYSPVMVSVPINDRYEEGYTKGHTEGYAEGVANAPKPILQEKTITENGEYTPDDGVDGFSKVLVNVANNEHNPLDYAVSLYQMFYFGNFTSGTELEVSFGSKANATATESALRYLIWGARGLKSIKVICGAKAPKTTSLDGIARCSSSESELERIDFSEAQQLLVPSTMSRTFEWRKGLKEVLGEFDMTNCTTVGSIASQCSSLETIRFKAGTIKKSLSLAYSPLLTDETIQSVINGLGDLTGGTAQTLTLHAKVGAKLTDEQKASASAKNWTISY